ncbi:MAG: hypothetical protein JKY87_00440 [Mariprofundus sp.]|nr:hypothetical protein [Mariprofundus sp.]
MNYKDLPHTAISTWSGFVYQGKVALYHSLELISSLGEQTCSAYQLQLDSLDDFAIIDGVNDIVSLHQVKAMKSQYASTYKGAFKKLKENADIKSCKKAYFHIARQITDKTPADIASEYDPIKLYLYGSDHWCSVNDIDNKIEEKIAVVCALFYPGDTSKQTSEYVQLVRHYLDGIVLTKILKIHKKVHEGLESDRQAALEETILFAEIIALLKEDVTQKATGEEYYFNLLLNDLHTYYQEYCIENVDSLSEEDQVKLSQNMLWIEGLDKSSMIQFIRSIIPHREFKLDSLSSYKNNSFGKEDIRDVFLVILHELKEPNFNSSKFLHWHIDGHIFTPSTIMQSQRNSENICEYIIKNAKAADLNVLFEADKIITDSMNVDSIPKHVPDAISSDESDQEINQQRITRWRDVSLISLENAKEEIND